MALGPALPLGHYTSCEKGPVLIPARFCSHIIRILETLNGCLIGIQKVWLRWGDKDRIAKLH